MDLHGDPQVTPPGVNPPDAPPESPLRPPEPPVAWGVEGTGTMDAPTGWTLTPSAGRPMGRPARVTIALAAAVVLSAMSLLNALLRGNAAGSTDAERTGYAIGTFLGALAVGAGIRFIYTRARPASGGVVSHWTLVAAVIASGLLFLTRPGLAPVVVPPGDPAARAVIGAPFSLTAADPQTTDQMMALFTTSDAKDAGVRAVAVRTVTRGGVIVGYLVVADVGIATGAEGAFLDGSERSIQSSGIAVEQVTIHDRPGILFTSTAAGLMWVDPPYGLIVYAADPDTARAIAEAEQP